MEAPLIIKPIPPQVINEMASFSPFDLKDFIQSKDGALQFSAGLQDGKALPKGMICTSDGILTGIPAKGTQGNYDVVVTASNEAGSVTADFTLAIKPSLATSTEPDYIDKLKSQVWSALEKNMPIPDLTAMLERDITPMDLYYLLERWGTLTIYDAFNLDPPGAKTALTLEGVSKHYDVFDRGSCVVMCPKDLFSHERTMEDGLQTSRAIAREVYKRGWTVELVGFDKLSRAAWVELQHLGDKFGKRLEIINFVPTSRDLDLYTSQVLEQNINAPE